MRSFNNAGLRRGDRQMNLEKAMGGLTVVLAMVGILAIGDWLSHPNIVMPEEGLALIPAYVGLIASVIVIVAGVILWRDGGRVV